MGRPFPNIPINPLSTIVVFVVAWTFLYLESVSSGGNINPLVFFLLVTTLPMFFIAQQGFKNIVSSFSLGGSASIILILILGGIAGGTLAFFAIAKPASILFTSLGFPGLAQSLFPLYNPFAQAGIGSLALAELTGSAAIFFVIVYFVIVSFGETGMIVYGWKNFSNFLSEKTRLSEVTISLISRMSVLFMWGVLHMFAVPNALPIFIIMAVTIGMAFFIGYFIIAEPFSFPEVGIQWLTYIAWFEIAFHATYDIWIGLGTYGIFTSLIDGLVIGGLLTSLTAVAIVTKRYLL